MNGLIAIVGEEVEVEEDGSYDTNRYSIFTQNLMLAEKVGKRQHLLPHTSMSARHNEASSHSAKSDPVSIIRADSPTIPEEDVSTAAPIAVLPQPPSRSGTTPANIGRPRTGGQKIRQTSQSASGDWTWKPSIPQRVSSIGTKSRKPVVPGRPDLVAFHRRSCQFFTSLDTTLSNASGARDTGSPGGSCTSTSPSLASSISTQATSILDENWHHPPAFPSFHLELHDPTQDPCQKRPHSPEFDAFFGEVNHTPRLAVRRSSSQLSPHITSTQPMIWTSDSTRQAEYAKIDAAHSGLKGFFKRMLPRRWAWAHGKRRNFHPLPSMPVQNEAVNADEDSVRRFRMSIASATEEAIRGAEEHGVSGYITSIDSDRLFMSEDATNSHYNSYPRDLNNAHESVPTKTPTMKRVLARVRSTDALARMFRSQSSKANKLERRAKTLSRDSIY